MSFQEHENLVTQTKATPHPKLTCKTPRKMCTLLISTIFTPLMSSFHVGIGSVSMKILDVYHIFIRKVKYYVYLQVTYVDRYNQRLKMMISAIRERKSSIV